MYSNNGIINFQYNNETDEIYLKKELYSDDLYRKIIEGDIFERLKDISFLGAIDCLYKNKKKHTRYEHTLSVAILALKYSKLANLKFEDQRYLVCSALLHDIGHGPLSHSMEPSFKKLFNISHHKAGNNIIKGKSPLGRGLYNVLIKNKIDVSKLLKLLNGESRESYAHALYNPINIDTIDGIIRSYTYLLGSKNKKHMMSKIPSIFNVLESVFSLQKQNVLDAFWKLKHDVYSRVINQNIHIQADSFSQQYILENKHIREMDFYLSESQFKESNNNLFKKLNALVETNKSNKYVFESSYIKRSYKINKNINIKSISDLKRKYTCIKKKDIHTYYKNEPTQLDLLFG